MIRRLNYLPFFQRQPSDGCPAEIRRNAGLFADFTCQHVLLCDARFRVLVPVHPCDVIPDVRQLVPLGSVFMPRGRGIPTDYRAARYPEVAYAWRCTRLVHDCLTIDRFRPASAGGFYGWDNVGVLCPWCQVLKWRHWPWLDYRPTSYKRKIDAYVQKKYGRQLWLGEQG